MGNLETKTGFKVVINYFDKTALISTANEAVSFINGLQYQGNSHGIKCNEHTENLLNVLFSGGVLPAYGKPFENFYQLSTTGCGNTSIRLYKALGDTVEAHNEVVKQSKEAEAQADRAKENERFQSHMTEMLEPLKGWYIVTITGEAFKIRGNDGKVTKSVKILADSKIDAYNKTVANLQENPPKNVSFWSYFEDPKYTLFEYVGEWTDEAEAEYR